MGYPSQNTRTELGHTRIGRQAGIQTDRERQGWRLVNERRHIKSQEHRAALPLVHPIVPLSAMLALTHQLDLHPTPLVCIHLYILVRSGSTPTSSVSPSASSQAGRAPAAALGFLAAFFAAATSAAALGVACALIKAPRLASCARSVGRAIDYRTWGRHEHTSPAGTGDAG